MPQGWYELGDKQLRYVYSLMAHEFDIDTIKTLALLRWSGCKVIGKQVSGAYLLKKYKMLFEVTPVALAEALPSLGWLCSLPASPVRLSKIRHQGAVDPDFQGVPFETFLMVENLYQGFLH